MRINILQGQKGYLLIDSLVAFFILAFALIGIAGLFLQASKNTQNSAKMTIEANLAMQKIEYLQEQNWTYLTTESNFSEAEEEINDPNYDAGKDKFKEKYYVKVKKPVARTDIYDSNNILELQVIVRTEKEKAGGKTGHKYVVLYTKS